MKKMKRREIMKKSFLGLFLASLMLVGCSGGTVLKDDKNDYYVTGVFADWGGAVTAKNDDGSKKYAMEAIAVNDARVKSLKKDIKKATMLYYYEGVVLTDGEGWGEEFRLNEGDEELVEYNGGQAIKVIQTAAGDEIPGYWAQGPESGRVHNLTPGKLFLPPYQEGEKWADSGDWAKNTFATAPGTYDVVFGRMPIDGVSTLIMGLIKVA